MASPAEIVQKLENQLDEITEMYDLAEKAYPYQLTRDVKVRSLNEDTHRRSMVAFNNYGPGSSEVANHGWIYGTFFAYVASRKGAAHLFDLSTMRKCYMRTLGFFMLGCSFATAVGIINCRKASTDAHTLNLNRRVH